MRRPSRSLAALLLLSRPAFAEPGFAEPPGRAPLVPDAAARPAEAPTPDETPRAADARLSVGPSLRVSDAATDAGFGAALDVGQGPVGGRVTGTWVRVGSDRGLSEYGADLWLDFGGSNALRPVLGAGAGVARLSDPRPSHGTASYGVGTLRASLEYVLPLARADARAGIDALGSVAVIQPAHTESPSPWLLVTARMSVGF